jgi:hypothetical protein
MVKYLLIIAVVLFAIKSSSHFAKMPIDICVNIVAFAAGYLLSAIIYTDGK